MDDREPTGNPEIPEATTLLDAMISGDVALANKCVDEILGKPKCNKDVNPLFKLSSLLASEYFRTDINLDPDRIDDSD